MTITPTDFAALYSTSPRAECFAAIVEDQSDVQPKLALADWLDENGHDDEAAAWRKLAERGWMTRRGVGLWGHSATTRFCMPFFRLVLDACGGMQQTHGLIRFVAAWCESEPNERPD